MFLGAKSLRHINNGSHILTKMTIGQSHDQPKAPKLKSHPARREIDI